MKVYKKRQKHTNPGFIMIVQLEGYAYVILDPDIVKQTFLMKRQTHHYVQSVPLHWPFFPLEIARVDSRIELFNSVDTYEKKCKESVKSYRVIMIGTHC